MVTLATNLVALLRCRAEADAQAFADQIEAAGRLSLEAELAWAICDHRSNGDELLVARKYGNLRLPLDPLWIEWDMGDGVAAERVGVLVRTLADGSWELKLAGRLEDPRRGLDLFLIPGSAIIEDSGIFFDLHSARHRSERHVVVEDDHRIYDLLGQSAVIFLRLLLMITAKNSPLRLGDAPDFVRLNRRRQKARKSPVLGTRPVSWKLSQVEGCGAAGGVTGEDARKRAMAHIVRGHPKIRKSGIFWWSPHFRNVVPEEASPSGRDYRVEA